MPNTPVLPAKVAAGVDPRGQRFAATLTAVVLAAVLLTQSTTLLAVQAVVFAFGAFAGPRWSPYSFVFARLVRPRIGPPADLEDAAAPRFAQGVGLAFAVIGLAGYAAGLVTVGAVATGFALVAALLNAVVGLCLGCEIYLAARRFAPARA